MRGCQKRGRSRTAAGGSPGPPGGSGWSCTCPGTASAGSAHRGDMSALPAKVRRLSIPPACTVTACLPGRCRARAGDEARRRGGRHLNRGSVGQAGGQLGGVRPEAGLLLDQVSQGRPKGGGCAAHTGSRSLILGSNPPCACGRARRGGGPAAARGRAGRGPRSRKHGRAAQIDRDSSPHSQAAAGRTSHARPGLQVALEPVQPAAGVFGERAELPREV